MAGRKRKGSINYEVAAKTQLRMESAIRIEIMNPHYNDAQIAACIGLSPQGYAQMKLRPEFKILQAQIRSGFVQSLDTGVREKAESFKSKLDALVPTALENLAQAAMQKMDKNLQHKATVEILDRCGYLSKVSRIGLPTPNQGGVTGLSDKDEEIADKLIEAMK